jgi:hypothetical protein
MDGNRFDDLTKGLAHGLTRRRLLGAASALATGVFGMRAAQAACPPGQTANRKGDCSCPPGTDPCPNGCFDRRRDTTNCGTCGNVCAAGAECIKGECRCPSGSAVCNGVCRTPASFANDLDNCGACGAVCPSGAPGTCEGDRTCAAGVCGFGPKPAGVFCRPTSGSCDALEACNGTSLSCPPDGFLPAGTICRGQSGPCDVAETCTGLSPLCPTNAGVPDGQQGGCPAGEFCLGGVCVECASATDCPASACATATCVNNTCGTAPVADGTSCGTGRVCLDGACVGNGACSTGNTCTARQEVPGCSNGCSCGRTTEGSAVCVPSLAVCNQACNTSADCPAGQICHAGPCCGPEEINLCISLCGV